MALWQDNSLQRITALEEKVLAQAHLIQQMSELLVDVSALVMLQTVTENSVHEHRGTRY